MSEENSPPLWWHVWMVPTYLWLWAMVVKLVRWDGLSLEASFEVLDDGSSNITNFACGMLNIAGWGTVASIAWLVL